MNIVQGLKLCGFTLNTEDNFNSIPGLKLWLDGRERVIKDATGSVSVWEDKSPESNNLFQYKVDRQPANTTGLWIDATRTVSSEFLSSNRRDYKFMHNGSAFAVYSLLKVRISDAASGFTVLTTGGNTQNGFRMVLSSTNSGRLLTNAYVGGVNTRLTMITNIGTTYPGLTTVIVKHIFKGVGVANNVINQYGSLLQTSTSAVTAYTNVESDNFQIASNGNQDKSFKTGIVLIYDWTGQSSAMIDSYDSKIMAMLNHEKLNIEQLEV